MEEYKKTRRLYLQLLGALILGALLGALLSTGIDYFFNHS
jgi:hypothetical protein